MEENNKNKEECVEKKEVTLEDFRPAQEELDRLIYESKIREKLQTFFKVVTNEN